jgi:hypothetical protein
MSGPHPPVVPAVHVQAFGASLSGVATHNMALLHDFPVYLPTMPSADFSVLSVNDYGDLPG